jgi:hypothetical protein
LTSSAPKKAVAAAAKELLEYTQILAADVSSNMLLM